MSDTSATRKLSTKDHKALYSILQPGDRTAALKLLGHKFSAAYVAMVANPSKGRYNQEVVDALLKAVRQREAQATKRAKVSARLHKQD